MAANFTGKQSLPRTVEVLARTLPAIAEKAPAENAPAENATVELSCGRLIELLTALVSGYTWALRDHIFDQQEEVKLALLHARHDMERDLLASEARFREVFDSSPVADAVSAAPQGRRASLGLPDRLGVA